jgi:hypothetical protein
VYFFPSRHALKAFWKLAIFASSAWTACCAWACTCCVAACCSCFALRHPAITPAAASCFCTSNGSLPGATEQIPNATAPLAETLRLNGYSTAAFGDWHETASWEASVAGPFDRWATHPPHPVPQEWIAKWRGQFDQGWDKLSADERCLFAPQAEVSSAYADDTDYHVGRMLKALARVAKATVDAVVPAPPKKQ